MKRQYFLSRLEKVLGLKCYFVDAIRIFIKSDILCPKQTACLPKGYTI